MNICIDSKILEKYNLSIDEFAVLILSYNHSNIENCVKSLSEKKLGVIHPNNSYSLLPTNKTKEMIDLVITESSKVVQKTKIDFLKLADKLRELYPPGKKGATAYQWRDSSAVIAKRLKTLVAKYGECFTEEEAIDATKRYIASFNGNYQYMQLLKYFIFKDDNSQLLSYLDNPEDNSVIESEDVDTDWVSELR